MVLDLGANIPPLRGTRIHIAAIVLPRIHSGQWTSQHAPAMRPSGFRVSGRSRSARAKQEARVLRVRACPRTMT
eukprot:scaffold2297_cov102-Isochrysis_galbana.AAC.2